MHILKAIKENLDHLYLNIIAKVVQINITGEHHEKESIPLLQKTQQKQR